jgi:hypothetical protein
MSQEIPSAPSSPQPEQLTSEQLKKEILDGLRDRESLKRDIIKELQPTGLKYRWLDLIRHPLFLLFCGFLLTGVATTFVKFIWDRGEWNRQQQLQTQKHVLEQKLELRDQVLEAVAAGNASVSEITTLFFYETAESAANKEEERTKSWQDASRSWNTSSEKLSQKVSVNFKNPEIQKTFDDIITKRHLIGVEVNNAMSTLRQDWTILDKKESQPYKDLIKRVRESILVPLNREVAEPSRHLLDLMEKEIQ